MNLCTWGHIKISWVKGMARRKGFLKIILIQIILKKFLFVLSFLLHILKREGEINCDIIHFVDSKDKIIIQQK